MTIPNSTPTRFMAGPTRLAGHKDKTVIVNGKETSLLDIIIGMVDHKAKVLADLFGGTNSVGSRALRAGIELITNDWRKQSYYCALALLVNRTVEPTDEDADRLTSGPLDPGPVTRLYGKPLGQANALEIDRIIRNAQTLRANGHEELAVAASYGITHVIMEALKVYHLHLAEDKSVFLGNEHLRTLDLASVWRRWFTCEYPRCLYAPDYPNVECHAMDAVDLIGSIRPDCAYVDTQYPTGGYDHVPDFKALEDLCEVFEGMEESRIGKTRPLPKHRFGNRNNYLGSMSHLLIQAAHIPQLIISLNTSSEVRPEEVALLVRATRRSCVVHKFPVDLPTTILGKTTPSNCECLLDCRLDEGLNAEIGLIKAELAAKAKGIAETITA
jgi:hypothetical protein